jgi:hypothetical protein
MGVYNSTQNKKFKGIEILSNSKDLNTLPSNNGSHCQAIK